MQILQPYLGILTKVANEFGVEPDKLYTLYLVEKNSTFEEDIRKVAKNNIEDLKRMMVTAK